MEITYDKEYTDVLVNNIVERYGGSGVRRTGTHVSDLLYCLMKAWGKHNIPEDQWLEEDIEDSPMLMWSQGLQFEDLIGTGQPQVPTAYCPSCNAVSAVPLPTIHADGTHEEVSKCSVCHDRWIIGTPDYRNEEIIHEAKQTRKSQRRGLDNAPWWIEQLQSYILFDHIRNPDVPIWGRLVVNWLMGDYGSKRKGERPRPPRSAIEAFKVKFTADELILWRDELLRRKSIVEGAEMPALTGMGVGDAIEGMGERSPAYDWECSSCPVGKALHCENWLWDDDDNEIILGGTDED